MKNTIVGSFYGKLLVITDFLCATEQNQHIPSGGIVTPFLCVQFEATLLDQGKLTEKVNLMEI